MKRVKSIGIGVTFAFCLFSFAFDSFAASGCNYPTSLDSYTNKVTGDYLTVADINSRSCAIEQLEIQLQQLLQSGKSGGNTLIGGSGAGQSLNLWSTSNATKGLIVLGTLSAYNEQTQRLGIGTVNPTRKLDVIAADSGAALFRTTSGTFGPRLELYLSSTQNDLGGIFWNANDSTAATRLTHFVQGWLLDGTAGSLDSELRFCVTNNATTGCNTTATLSSLGVWTDSSSAANKEYEGDIQGGAIDNLKKLTTFGIYRAKNLPPGKIKNAERHYSPTAEDFHTTFGLGSNTGIAAKDAAFIAAKAVLELEARVQALEKKLP